MNTEKREFPYPAKLPSMKWLDNTAPLSPLNMQVYRAADGTTTIEWESSNPSEGQVYAVYESSTEDFDIRFPLISFYFTAPKTG